MAIDKAPGFLRGTFAWSALGYAYAQEPSVNLLSREALAATDPWIHLASVLEHAKGGDHQHVRTLKRWFQLDPEAFAVRACVHLIGDAGTESDLPLLIELLERGPDQLRAYAAEAAAMTGRLSFVASMLSAWKQVATAAHHQTIGYSISSLLEKPGGAIAAHAGQFRIQTPTGGWKNTALRELAMKLASDDSGSEFEVQVQSRLAELRNTSGDKTLFWRGQAFTVQELVQSMYAFVRNTTAGPTHGLFISMRHKLEATTGLNCSTCFQNGALQPLGAAAVLEGFMESNAAQAFEPDVRYFFSHRIPD